MADLSKLREALASLDAAQAAQSNSESYKAASTVIAAAREVAAQADAQPAVAAVPEGWVMVPKVPTEEMWAAAQARVSANTIVIDAGPAKGSTLVRDPLGHAWKAMLDAAQPIQQTPESARDHVLSMDCWCKPKRDDEVPSVVVHNDAALKSPQVWAPEGWGIVPPESTFDQYNRRGASYALGWDDCREAMLSVAPAAPASEGVETLREFARWALHESNEGLSFDGADVQDKAVELGLLIEVEREGPCGENCACAEFGDFPTNCYAYSSLIAAAKPGEVGR